MIVGEASVGSGLRSEGQSAHFEFEVAVWRDPLTPPHTKTECNRVCDGPFGVKFCCGYGTECQWMECRAVLIVDLPTEQDARARLEECHRKAAIAGLATGIVAAATGGGAVPAAFEAYVSYFSACAQEALGTSVSVRIDQRCGWSNWVGC